MGSRADLGVLEKRQIPCPCKNSSPGPSSPWPGHYSLSDSRYCNLYLCMFSMNTDRVVTMLCIPNLTSKLHAITIFIRSLTWILSAQQSSVTPNRVQQRRWETIFLPSTAPLFLCLLSGAQGCGFFNSLSWTKPTISVTVL